MNTPNLPVTVETPELIKFKTIAQEIVTKHHSDNNFPWKCPVIEIVDSTKYIRIMYKEENSSRIYAFIDKTNGNVLKPASYKAPAKHARGNLFDEFNGTKGLTSYGPAYLR